MKARCKAIEQELRKLYEARPTPSPHIKWQTIVRLRDELHDMYPALKENKSRGSTKLMDAFHGAAQVAFVPSTFFPNQKQIDAIKSVVGQRLLLDVGHDMPRKSGAVAGALHHLCGGLRVKAYNCAVFKQDDPYFKIEERNAAQAIEKHKYESCVLGLFAPTDSPILATALHKYHAYGGDVVLVGGARDRFGCAALWLFLETKFTCLVSVDATSIYPFMPRTDWLFSTPLHVYVRRQQN